MRVIVVISEPTHAQRSPCVEVEFRCHTFRVLMFRCAECLPNPAPVRKVSEPRLMLGSLLIEISSVLIIFKAIRNLLTSMDAGIR